jgi:hypothetical protein
VIPQGVIAPDSVRLVLKQVFSGQAYLWSERSHPLAFLGRWLQWLVNQLAELATHHPGAYYALLCGLIVVLVAIMVHAGWIVWQSMRARRRDEAAGLPAVRRAYGPAWHLAEFRRLAGLGRYTEALAHRFMALVSELQAPAGPMLDASRTPAEHARAAQLDPTGRVKMELLVDELYRRLFGGAPCTAEDLGAFDGLAVEVGAHRAAR